jgi:GNAT superfamily N-acetyltransferase
MQTRLATEEDTPRMLALVRQSLGEGPIPRSIEYWRWKHAQNPFGASPCLLAEADGEIVGLRAFMRWRWQSGARAVPAVRAVDTATHRDWRGKGIFRKLTLALVEQMTAEGVGFVFNTPNSQSRPGYLKMGWESLGRTRLWVRPSRPLRIARALLRRPAAAEANDGGDDDSLPFSPAAELLEQPGVSEFLRSLPDDDARLSTRVTPEYLSWRYAAVPGFRYYAAWELERDAAAAVVFRSKRQGALRELRVCDLIVGTGARSRAAASHLLRTVARQADADFAALMTAPGTRQHAAALGAAFIPAPRVGPIFTVRPLAAGVSPVDPTRLTNWRPSIGALELF